MNLGIDLGLMGDVAIFGALLNAPNFRLCWLVDIKTSRCMDKWLNLEESEGKGGTGKSGQWTTATTFMLLLPGSLPKLREYCMNEEGPPCKERACGHVDVIGWSEEERK